MLLHVVVGEPIKDVAGEKQTAFTMHTEWLLCATGRVDVCCGNLYWRKKITKKILYEKSYSPTMVTQDETNLCGSQVQCMNTDTRQGSCTKDFWVLPLSHCLHRDP